MTDYYCPDCGALLWEVSYPWFNCSGCNKDWEEDVCSGVLTKLSPSCTKGEIK
jgi:hypothetical protein